MALRRSERIRQKAQANKEHATTKKGKQTQRSQRKNAARPLKAAATPGCAVLAASKSKLEVDTPNNATKEHHNSSSSSSSSNDSRKRAAARDIQPLKSRPAKALITEKDHEIQHWLDHGKMPGLPKIDPFYAPYLAQLKRKRLLPTRSQSVPESRESKRITYDSDDCVDFLGQNQCPILVTREPSEAFEATCKGLKGSWTGSLPTGTLFDEDKIQRIINRLRLKSEANIIRAIGELVVPSVDLSLKLDTLVGIRDEPWDDSIPLDEGVPLLQHRTDYLQNEKQYLPRPQPDYSVGFSPLAFSNKQLDKLRPFLGGKGSNSFFRSTMELHFPFMVSEVKSKTTALEVAENQSMHTMALSLRGIVYLFRLAKREKELDGQILGFAIIHNRIDVRIHGYYPVISGNEVTYHFHSICAFQLSSETRWDSYKFIMAIYHNWAPLHLKRICAVIEQLPESVIISPELTQSQTTEDSSTPKPSQDLAGTAEWSSSRRGSEAVSSNYGISGSGVKTRGGKRRKRKR